MRKIVLPLISGICLMTAASANADGVALNDRQLDQVTAGALDLSTLTIEALLSGQFGLGNSPLLRTGAGALADSLADGYAEQNSGQDISDAPVLGPAFLELKSFSLSSSFPVPAPAETTVP